MGTPSQRPRVMTMWSLRRFMAALYSFGAGFGSRPFFNGTCGLGGIRNAFETPRSKRS